MCINVYTSKPKHTDTLPHTSIPKHICITHITRIVRYDGKEASSVKKINKFIK